MPITRTSQVLRSSRTKKLAAQAPEHLEYTSSLLKKEQIPLLENVIIPARDLDVGQR